jgi:hypothetical protein
MLYFLKHHTSQYPAHLLFFFLDQNHIILFVFILTFHSPILPNHMSKFLSFFWQNPREFWIVIEMYSPLPNSQTNEIEVSSTTSSTTDPSHTQQQLAPNPYCTSIVPFLFCLAQGLVNNSDNSLAQNVHQW